MNDSLPEELEQLVNLNQVDWSGKLIGRTELEFRPVPAVDRNSNLYAKISQWIDILENFLKPADSRKILLELARLRLHFPTATMSDYESELLIKDYIADLSIFPLDIIIRACNEYRYSCESKFFPSIAKLLELIRLHIYSRQLKLSRLKKIKETSDELGEETRFKFGGTNARDKK